MVFETCVAGVQQKKGSSLFHLAGNSSEKNLWTVPQVLVEGRHGLLCNPSQSLRDDRIARQRNRQRQEQTVSQYDESKVEFASVMKKVKLNIAT